MKANKYLFAAEMPETLRVKTVFVLRGMGYRANMDGYYLSTNAPAFIAKDAVIYRPTQSVAAEF